MERIERAVQGRPYAYIGYSRASGVYHIYRPMSRGKYWYMHHSNFAHPSHFAHLLRELNAKLGSL